MNLVVLPTGVFGYFKVNISPVHNNTSYKCFIANEKEPYGIEYSGVGLIIQDLYVNVYMFAYPDGSVYGGHETY
ncbi:hypothetical protein [Thermoanaerobacter italicus]|uniref:hypothetical protein n=1 Tax=Thermoanaerobacter italicus TaxID=108150 RepID=UPI00145EC3B8|nr:hypothetical protein [Thermoanaerobacter italicus]